MENIAYVLPESLKDRRHYVIPLSGPWLDEYAVRINSGIAWFHQTFCLLQKMKGARKIASNTGYMRVYPQLHQLWK